jgi:hypothetical protein
MMTRHIGIVSLVVVSFMSVVVVLVSALSPNCIKCVGLDVWNLPTLHESVKEGNAKAAALDEKNVQMCREREFCDYLVARLIDGTTTLAQATDELEPILRERTGFRVICESEYHVATLRQGIARCLIKHAKVALYNDSRWTSVSSRLEAEYAQLKE